MARWSGWGTSGLAAVFDENRADLASDRARVAALLTPEEFAAARRTSINAHYTDAELVKAMWGVMGDLGLTEGRVLEPGCGSGTFIGLAPEAIEMTGVELDPMTAAIASALYPHARIHSESFALTKIPTGYFDGVIGNVPFADVTLRDPLHNPGRHRMHNHFIVKGLHLTRPGGLVAVLTSRWTLDALDPAARKDMAELADLVGAVRLPTGALRRAAGTDAVADLLIFRRREPGVGVRELESWMVSSPIAVPAPGGLEQVPVNRIFHEHPERVLGSLQVRVGMFGAPGLEVDGVLGADLHANLRTVLDEVVAEARDRHLVSTPPLEPDRFKGPIRFAASDETDGHLDHTGKGFTIVDEGVHQPLLVPASQQSELIALLGMRDAVAALIDAEANLPTDKPNEGLEKQRAGLADRYRRYVDRYGPINRFSLRPTGRTSPEGDPAMARVVPPAVRTLMRDPRGPLVVALEVFDDQTGVASPAGILRSRQLTPRQPVTKAESAADAVAVCLDRHGRLDVATIAELLGCTPQAACQRLRAESLAFEVPGAEPPSWEPAPAYLSGNVRRKLAEARLAAVDDPERWRRNVDALRDAMPLEVGPSAITVRVGAVWIDAQDYTDYLAEISGDPRATVTHYGSGKWEVTGGRWGVRASNEWGTEDLPAGALLERLLTQQRIEVYVKDADDARVLHPIRTEAAKEKARLISERFAQWVWETPERAARLVAVYNEKFNSLVLRDYTGEGAHLSLPGLAATFEPRPHQRAAVARIINEPNTGLFHAVGAGKTAEMVMGAMELKRLGLATKPCVVVPNNMLEQFAREWQQLYPQARLLTAYPDDVSAGERRRFVARVATNEWDAVLMTRTTFQRLSVTPETQAAYFGSELALLRAQLAEASEKQATRAQSVKSLEKALLRREESLKALLAGPRDPGVSFESTGIDLLIVDELHDYKNLATPSNIRDAAITGSMRASDLHMKIEYLRRSHGGRAIVAATATPIANSITEMWVLQRYMDPETLAASGLHTFDQWAATFGEVVSDLELSVTGGSSFKTRDRFARFGNVPALLAMLHRFGDFKTAEDLHLPVPLIAKRPDGKRQPNVVIVQPSPELEAYISELGGRADQVARRLVTPDQDNMLKICTDGRKAGLDIRLINPHSPTLGGSKIDVAADLIAQIWAENRHNVYLDPTTGEESPVRGALQLVFCDLGTPGSGWNVYDTLREELYARGLPGGSVRFAHEARNDAEKARLFSACRSGHVAVLVGSTQKMGVGTNVQARAVHLLDMDAPWRPADVEQRHGRIIRQGNQNPEVRLTQIVTERSFDAYMWQALETKARFIDQVLSGKLVVDGEVEDIGSDVLSFAEVKALSSGNPLLLEKAQASTELAKYQRLRNAYLANQRSLSGTVTVSTKSLAHTRELIPVLDEAAARTLDTKGDAFTARIHGRKFTSRVEAAAALEDILRYGLSRHYHLRFGEIAELGGHTLTAHCDSESLYVNVTDAPVVGSVMAVKDLSRPLESGFVLRLEHLVRSIPQAAARLHVEEQALLDRIAQAQRASTAPFAHEHALAAATARYEAVTRDIAAHDLQPAAPTATALSGDPDTSPSEESIDSSPAAATATMNSHAPETPTLRDPAQFLRGPGR